MNIVRNYVMIDERERERDGVIQRKKSAYVMKMNFADEIELRDYASTLLNLMSASDRFIIEMYYFKGFTRTKIGKKFDVCQTRVSQALRDILMECRRVVERLDIRKEVKWRPVITKNSILFNHNPDSRAKFTEKRKQEKLARLAFEGNTRAFELYCLRDDHIRRQWKYRMKHKMYVHPRFRRLYYENIELFEDF